jgi:hypothetical protein
MRQEEFVQDLLSIIYVSSARADFRGRSLAAMLHAARDRNAAAQVTGCLLHPDGSFMQYLEGVANHLLPIYTAIVSDTRHSNVVELYRGQQQGRMFQAWSMEFAQPGDALWTSLYRLTQAQAPEQNRVQNPTLSRASSTNSESKAQSMPTPQTEASAQPSCALSHIASGLFSNFLIAGDPYLPYGA